MDLDFGGELSEEWIPQPESSTPSSSPGRESAATSPPDSTIWRTDAGEKTNPVTQKVYNPLREVSVSDLNVLRTTETIGHSKISSIAEPEFGDNVSENALDGDDGTVHISKSPVKEERSPHATPEWRRRLVQGQRGLTEQKDLFSSRPIEKIFDKPANTENDRKVMASLSPPREKRSSLPQPVQSPTRSQDGTDASSFRARDRLYVGNMAQVPASPLSKRIGLQAVKAPPDFATTCLVTSLCGERQRSRSLPRSGSGLAELPSEIPTRPSSSCGDSALELPEDFNTYSEHQTRLVSGQSVGYRLFSHSTDFITTSRGNAGKDDSFFTRPLSQLSFERLPRSYLEERLRDASESPPQLPTKFSNSPLKLFVEHDSFTSRRLHRRVSQLEDRKPEQLNGGDQGSTDAALEAAMENSEASQPLPKPNRRVSNFGAGDLDEHVFQPQSPAFNVPSLDIKHTKVRSSQRHSSASQHRYRAISQSSTPPTVDASSAGALYQAAADSHTSKKRILAAPRRPSIAQTRQTSSYGLEDDFSLSISSSDGSRARTNSLAGRKRKDARYYNEPGAPPEVIALRTTLVAKRQAQRKASSLAAMIIRAKTDTDYDNEHDNRKKSLTTADFFHEANAIMQKIRARDLPQSSLLDEQLYLGDSSETGSLFHEEFTIEQLSRPASREGLEQRVQAPPRAMDARIVSHLRKFEEKDDLGLEWSASSKPASEAEGENDEVLDDGGPKIHIRNQIVVANHDGDNSAADASESASVEATQSSTTDSVPTSSSRGSGNKATISPDKVSHLLNHTMGGMTFDQNKLCWVKHKAQALARSLEDAFDSEMTEDDPLEGIPDLTVDESQEMKNTKEFSLRPRLPVPDNIVESQNMITGQGNDLEAPFDPSSTISESHRFASSGPIIETRATSWGDAPPDLPHGKDCITSRLVDTADKDGCVDDNDTETVQEIVRESEHSARIAFSLEGSCILDTVHTPFEKDRPHPSVKSIKATGTPSSISSSKPLADPRVKNRGVVGDETEAPMASNSLLALPNQSLFTPCSTKYKDNMHLALSTPQTRLMAGASRSIPSSPLHYSILRLSPLPDFTVNQPDESLNLDMNYAVRKRGLTSLPEIEKNFSLAIQELVEKITDIEPHEPFWEYMQELNLRGQNLWTLHMLADFCSRIEELNVSRNELGQLNGAPRSLQVLKASHNHLSGLTAWAHLPNLQYLNVSYNSINTLKSFSCLVHLRELNVEGNEIEDLEGISNLKNLISLNLRRNKVKILDLQDVNLRRLKTLDIRSNRVQSIVGLEGLSSLRDLNLGNNLISDFSCETAMLPKSLRRLDLSHNRLATLDLSTAPPLDSLSIDGNGIASVKGLRQMKSIRKISWRHQSTAQLQGQNASIIECCKQAHLLDLSENRIPVFAPSVPFLNLRKLELVSCGIASLGDDFGLRMPNLRVLNLSDNGLDDIRPLLGIEALEELYVARNRLGKLRLTAKVIREFAATLRYLDCRDNPATVGFYSVKRTDQPTKPLSGEEYDMTLMLATNAEREKQSRELVRLDENEDVEYLARLDEETLLRRRVYEALLLFKLKALVFWDGLDMEYRRKVDRETMWARLLELGVLTKLPPA